MLYLLPDEAVASKAIIVIVAGSHGLAGERMETLLEPAK